MEFTVPENLSKGLMCPYTGRYILADTEGAIHIYSSKQADRPKHSLELGSGAPSEMADMAVGLKWHGEEALVVVANSLCTSVISVVDGTALLNIHSSEGVRSMSVWKESTLYCLSGKYFFVIDDINVLLDADHDGENGMTDADGIHTVRLEQVARRVRVEQEETRDFLLVPPHPIWPYSEEVLDEPRLLAVGNNPPLLLARTGGGGSVLWSVLSSTLLSRPPALRTIEEYPESGRSFDRLQVLLVNGRELIVCHDDTLARIVWFDAHSLLIDHVLRGVRGGTVFLKNDRPHVLHPREGVIIDHEGGKQRLDANPLIIGDKVFTISHCTIKQLN